MGFFSVFTSFLGDAASAIGGIVDPIEPLLSGGASLLGGINTNSANADLARQQEAFQANMSGSGYQRAVADLEKAGLNPMLAYSNGPAAMPSGATIAMQNPVTPAVTNALQTASTQADIEQKKNQNELIAAQTENTESQVDVNRTQALKNVADAHTASATAANLSAQNPTIKSQSQIAKSEGDAASTWYGRNIAPYLPSFLQGAHSASSISNIFK